ncbi:MAG: MATE family efflux transporter [Lachnospiraceae bacterium]|nr:MATE family efflux transporter [Lachnospiraceae bacterium]
MSNETNAPAENKMGVMPVNRLLITMALPMMLSMLVQALYNVVDSIFVARLSEDALTAVSMAFPVQNLMIGVSSGLAVGTNALLSRELGKKNFAAANRMAMHGIFLEAIGYLIFLVFGLTASRLVFVLQGASETIAQYGEDYLTIVLCFSFGIYTEMIFERLLQSTGRTIYTMFTQGLGAVINIIFDPLLIFGIGPFPAMGIRGAAAATVLGQIMAGILALFLNFKVNDDVRLRLKGFQPRLQIIGNILYIGVPSILMVAIGSIMTFCINNILVVFSSTAVAVFGVYFKLQSFAFMPVFGMNNGIVPIVAYNYGARKPDRITRTVRLGMLYAVCIMFCAFLVMQLLPTQLLRLFSASDDMLAIGVPALRTISYSFLLAGICVVCTSFFQAMGSGVSSMLISFLRQLVVLVPLAFLLSRTGNLSMVWYAWPIAELVSLAFSLIFFVRLDRKLLKPIREEQKAAAN